MGRSKFPGKPSKHVNKKRVNVLPYSITPTSNNQNYNSPESNSPCDTEQTVTFSGFSSQEVNQATKHAKAQQRELKTDNAQPPRPADDDGPDVMIKNDLSKDKNDIDDNIENSNKTAINKINYKLSLKSENIIKHKLRSLRNKRIVKKSDLSIGIRVCDNQESVSSRNGVTRKPIYNVSTRRQQAKLCRSKTSTPVNSPVSLRQHEKESTSLVGKFVLPSRSLHSSRVIKPNKRFLNSEQIHNVNGSEFLSKNIKKVKVVESCKAKTSEFSNIRQRRKCTIRSSQTTNNNGDEVLAKSKQSKTNITKCNVTKNSLKVAEMSSSGSAGNWATESNKDSSETVTSESSNSASSSWSCGKLVLRKARLQLHTHSSENTDGPFSNYSSATVNPPGTVTCGVCGAVRFYRFVKQARKFNIYSCESCRKFISKMIKRQACSKTCAIPTLVCHKGQGMCHVPPIVRSQQWKLIRCAYKARCPACWLKMCLRSFQMPTHLKISLTNLLPENMRSYVDQNISLNNDTSTLRRVSTSSRQLMSWQPINFDVEGRKTRSLREKHEKLIEKFVSPLKVDIMSYKNEVAILNNREKKHRKTRLVRKKSIVKLNAISIPTVSESTKRQKIDLKGPRVKHVCRSASIVLGQPLATFPVETKEKKIETTCEKVQEEDSCISCITVTTEEQISPPAEKEEPIPPAKPEPLEEKISTNILPRRSAAPLISRKNVKHPAMLEVHAQTGQKRTIVSAPTPEVLISTDFWENYDPDEVCQTGFGIIGSESFPVQILCFLCGSAGQEQLIHCASCCEPYHPFCLDSSLIDRGLQDTNQVNADGIGSFPSNDPNWRFSWTCARCTACHSCGISVTKEKVNCQKCHKYYHPQCLNSKWRKFDRPMICSSCLRCKSCGSENITKFVCNLPLCASCFKLRKKGNFCPLCQRCYDDNDFDIKMMECGECKRWVHAKCEGLSDEKYQVLSYLPESVAFVCRICSENKPSHWQDAMEGELKNNYHNVLRSLGKNRTARELLKWSPMKNHTCACRPVEFSKKISFSDSEEIDETCKMYASKIGGKNINNLREIMHYDVDDESSQDSKSDDVDCNLDCIENSSESVIKSMRKKFSLKECSVRIKQYVETKDKYVQFKALKNSILNSELFLNDRKEINVNVNQQEANVQSVSAESEHRVLKQDVFHCNKHDNLPITSLLDIKKKVNLSHYKTLKEFQCDVEEALNKASCGQLIFVLQNIMKEIFPWYDPSSSSINENGDLNKTNNLQIQGIEIDKVQCMNNNLLELEVPAPTMKGIPQEALTKYIYSEGGNIHDTRICVLCKGSGDGIPSLEDRLLYCGQNDWVHANCALWSPEVFEEIDGSLQNVHSAISRGRLIRCGVCKQKGASIGCCAKGCSETYHYTCSRTLNCSFMHDKTVYCPSHFDCAANKPLVKGDEFEIRRPIYVELDGKKKKYIEPIKAHYLIGSLTVTNLGKFYHPLSDNEEAIIPSEFMCTRLFWSTVEPWKIVRYTISTSILKPKEKHCQTPEKHFTVDHSLNADIVNRGFEEIECWKKMLETGIVEEKPNSTYELSTSSADDGNVVAQVLEQMLELICTKEVEENCDDEPQNATDLLPPELKDAIFEDLPHDLLDGISMQDIFPKLMSYEDVITMDFKNSDMVDTDFLKDTKTDLTSDILSSVDSDEFALQSQYKAKKDIFATDNDLWLEPKCAIQGLDDYVQSKMNTNSNGSELKRSKSEIFPGIKKITRNRNHQRSCSLTWSCKLDNSLANKKRKVSCAKNVSDFGNNLFMVVDGTGEKGGMLQELRLPEGVLMTMGRTANSECVTDTMRELKYRLEENTALATDRFKTLNQQLEQGKENKCRIWQSRSHSRVLQVDGTDDYSSSESDSPVHEPNTNSAKTNKYAPDITAFALDEPVKCDRCQCTYRTHISYNKHLTTCDTFTSESDSDVPVDNDKIENHSSTLDHMNPNEINQIEYHKMAIGPSGFVSSSSQMTVSKPEVVGMVSSNQHTAMEGGHIITAVQTRSHVQANNHKQSIQLIQQNFQNTVPCSPIPVTVPVQTPTPIATFASAPAPISTSLHTPITTFNVENVQPQILNDSAFQNIQIHQNHLNQVMNNTINNSVASTNIEMSDINIQSGLNQCLSVALVPPMQKQTMNNKFKTNIVRSGIINSRGRGRPTRQIVTKRIRPDKPIQIISQTPNMQTNNTIRLAQQNSPTVIIQHLSSPNLMPTYVEAFQQQTGQNLQCIATIVPSEYKPPSTPSFLTPNSIMPGTFQIQSAETPNVISLQNNGLGVVPVMGTIIQQQRPAIQCGMMTTEQLLLGSPVSTMPTVPTVDTIVTDPSGSMYLTSQPVYYGFETIVQNTVMQSQQFMSTALPGVLASNSSYSATTTQVFQASKIEPMVEINGSSYILVNPTMSQVATPLTVNTQPVIAPLPNKPVNIIASQASVPEPNPSYSVQIAPVPETPTPPIDPIKFIPRPMEQAMTIVKPQVVTCTVDVQAPLTSIQTPKVNIPITTSNLASTNSITLPLAPYATENGIPMNIVNPIPQVSTSNSVPQQTSRPMNRVLPMQTTPQRDFQKARSPVNKVISFEPPEILNKLSETVDKIQETLNNDADNMQSVKSNANDNLLKLESASLKLVFQKQSQDGIYKISNKYVSKNNIPIQVAPMKQSKSKTVETVINVRSNVPMEKKEARLDKSIKQIKNSSENNPSILYKVHSEDGFDYSSTSLTELWTKVFEAVQNARALHNMPPLPQDALNMMNGLQLMGLKSNGLRYLVEQLPGSARCVKYKPSFHKKSKIFDQDSNLEDGHSQGAIRCQAHINRKEPYDMFSWLASRHRKPEYFLQLDFENNTSRRASSINLPMAMRFRQLKETSKQAVGVYRSNIHGRGLFCLRDIESGEMVIEYAGEVIRSTLTDKREKYYNSKGIGCYMFRVDDNLVVDATMKGNAARFINHSCDPNCYSRVLEILGHKHILIFALRKIIQGEELTYDYKFPFEEDKIPCTCGSRRCRKYLN